MLLDDGGFFAPTEAIDKLVKIGQDTVSLWEVLSGGVFFHNKQGAVK
jgi:hypothetical protein